MDHHIELEKDEKGQTPKVPWGPLYNMSRDELLVLRKTLTELLDKGFIRVSNSPAAAPVLFAKKPGGGLRFCVDYRGLNKITRKDRYPLPLINETLQRISRAKWYTKLDIVAAFYHIRIAEGSEWMTAFRTRYGLYEWLVTPFGLANAPSTFQRYVNWALREFLDEFVSAYMDDILIFTEGTLDDHRKQVRKVLQKLREAGLTADINKSDFEVTTTKYLGFIIDAKEGIKMDPEKVKAITEWQAPTTVKGVRGFLGFANFYRRFIKDFSKIASPLTDLTKKDIPFRWTAEAQQAFETLKEMFIAEPTLLQFDADRETVVETDSSGYVVGGTLMQYDDKGLLRPCAFFSKRNSPAECNYEIYDKELLAVIRCLEEWEAELLAVRSFKILTDHRNLEYFLTVRRLSERQMRWAELLSRFNFKMVYRPGILNSMADALSRREQDLPRDQADERLASREVKLLKDEWIESENLTQVRFQKGPEEGKGNLTQVRFQKQGINEASACLVQLESPTGPPPDETPTLEEAWEHARANDPVLKDLERAVREGKPRFPVHLGVKASISECSLSQTDELLWRGRRWVPADEPLRTRIIQETHDSALSGHPGREVTTSLVGRQFFWPGYAGDIRRFIRNCTTCRASNAWKERRQGLLKPLPVPDRIWSELSMDFVTDLPESNGCTNLLVVTDRLGKGVILEPCRKIDADTVAKAFIQSVYRRHGLPRAIVTDRGTQFTGALWARICQVLGIKRRLSTAWHPETDGSTERMNQTTEAYLRKYVNYMQDDWTNWLPSAEVAINNRDAAATGVSPFFLEHGYHVDPLDFTDQVAAGNEQSKSPIQRAEAILTKLKKATEWAQASMAAAQQEQEDFVNRSRDPAVEYRIGDEVWLDLRNLRTDRPSKKLDAKNGRFKVLEKIGSHAYRLDTPGTIHNVFHVNLLRPVATDPLPFQRQPIWHPPAVIGEGLETAEWEVEKIVKERTVRGKHQLLVKWAGWETPTWEPASALEETAALDEFLNRRGGA
ncbi:reverse transcriptase domain-containing protein [Escherichia coli]|uniref:reverse transcriptase domain-containing protein n=1 Tax=Escherichia coli TaxID=562 RepID=UPI0024A9487D|nr:reverse transcriptase domain-containing protein [Escherichia coli]MDI6015458.1 reverse transcriptase domain-containing protein [Escherichia coli]